ncbi:MAG: GNAT family N-acetyltransferase [Microlunatus sp.]
MMTTLPLDTIEDLYPRYAAVWNELVLKAAARHRLSLDEFRQQMLDPRLEKHVVLDEDNRVIAMTTITADLEAIPWINPTFYQQRFPKECANSTMYYLGYTFVDADHRRTRAIAIMTDAVDERVSSAQGVIGFDMCELTIEHGIGRRLQRLFPSSREVVRGDTQTYLIADYRVPQHRASDRFVLTSLAERPDLLDEVRLLLSKQWPAYALIGDAGHRVNLDALLLDLSEHQLLLLDEQEGLAGVGFSLPVRWDGTIDALPAGWDDAIVVGERLHRDGGRSDTLCVLSITVAPNLTGRGLAERLIGAFKERAARIGAHAVIIPVRPSQKARYPLIPMPEYLSWTRSDGQSFDRWMRVHLRLGASVMTIAPESMVITGTVAQWESWLNMPLPASGEFVIDGGLVPLLVDRTIDQGRYVEPNVWVSYQIGH